MALAVGLGLQASNSSPHLTTSTLQLDVVAMAEQDLETTYSANRQVCRSSPTSSREFESLYEQANLDNAARVRALRRKLTHLSTHRNSALRRYSLVKHRLRGMGQISPGPRPPTTRTTNSTGKARRKKNARTQGSGGGHTNNGNNHLGRRRQPPRDPDAMELEPPQPQQSISAGDGAPNPRAPVLWKSQKAKWNASQLGYGSYNY